MVPLPQLAPELVEHRQLFSMFHALATVVSSKARPTPSRARTVAVRPQSEPTPDPAPGVDVAQERFDRHLGGGGEHGLGPRERREPPLQG